MMDLPTPTQGALSENMRLPDFLVLGTQKGGTTTLQHFLNQHPKVFLAPNKEVHYFTKHWAQPITWYANHFIGASTNQRCGEITPFYLFHPEAPQRINSLLPDTKLIVLLRDPVERSISQYFHSKRLGLESLSLEHALEVEVERLRTGKQQHLQEHSYVSRSRYLEQLDRYMQLFKTEQLLVLQSEAFFNNPAKAWRKLESFLGLSKAPIPAVIPRANPGRWEATSVSDEVRSMLRQQLLATAQEVRRRYGFGWSWA